MTVIMYSVKWTGKGASMRVTPEQAAAHREKILEVAGALFRERGFDGIGVADIMKSAGLTHGGFYGHFASKDDLAAEASARALEKSLARWDALAKADRNPLDAIVASYLSEAHRDRPGSGCAIAALGSDTSRQGKSVRQAVANGMRDLVGRLGQLFSGRPKERRQKALAGFAAMLGAVIMARVVDDPELSKEILDAVSDSVLASR